MKIKVNNELRDIVEGSSLADILKEIPQAGTATALNGIFVPKDAREATILRDGDELTIISAAYGG